MQSEGLNTPGRHSKYLKIPGPSFMSQERFSYSVISPECSHTRRAKTMLSLILLGRWPLELCSLPPVISTCLPPTGISCQMIFISECQHWNLDCSGVFSAWYCITMTWYKPMLWLFGFGIFHFCFKLPLTCMGVKFGQCWMPLEFPPFTWFCWFFMSGVGLSNMCWHNISLEQYNDSLC